MERHKKTYFSMNKKGELVRAGQVNFTAKIPP